MTTKEPWQIHKSAMDQPRRSILDLTYRYQVYAIPQHPGNSYASQQAARRSAQLGEDQQRGKAE